MDARYGLTWQETKSFKFNACRHVYQRHCRHPNIHSSLGHTRGAKNRTGINIHLEATPKFPFNNKHRVLQPTINNQDQFRHLPLLPAAFL
ncbi:hypothetical protein TNCT_9111 [Trichonephila clavata]|uniref:Uncharacterized protein n=1 Tax=Trichonephila clavata TaxID=2740835 RepID=A0A8X6K757_TRICU|nr:hypothetical protein TNCT_9111 [Trichonephila clavata]